MNVSSKHQERVRFHFIEEPTHYSIINCATFVNEDNVIIRKFNLFRKTIYTYKIGIWSGIVNPSLQILFCCMRFGKE